MRLTDLMSKQLITIDVNDSVRNALMLMQKKKVSRLLVRKNKEIVGILTERDLARRLGSEKERKLSDAHIHVSSCYTKHLLTADKGEDVKAVARKMLEYGISSVAVADQWKVIGLVTKTDLIKLLENSDEQIEKIMTKNVKRIEVGSRLLEARRMMLHYGIKRLVVTDKDKLVGIITESDIAKALGLFRKVSEGKHWEEKMRGILVDDAMTSAVLTLKPTDKVGACVRLMLDKDISGIPVVDGEEIKGIVTKTDLVKALVMDSKL
jgi:CBS domain-containing protein